MDIHRERTHNHDTIRQWIERHGGRPAFDTRKHALAVDLADGDEALEEAAWNEFFRTLDRENLDFEYRPDAPYGNARDSYGFTERK